MLPASGMATWLHLPRPDKGYVKTQALLDDTKFRTTSPHPTLQRPAAFVGRAKCTTLWSRFLRVLPQRRDRWTPHHQAVGHTFKTDRQGPGEAGGWPSTQEAAA